MKKAICLTLIFTMFASLVGCSNSKVIAKNAYYNIEKDGESFFLLFKKKQDSSGDLNSSQKEPTVYFSSIAEMKSDILKGDFTEDELGEIQRFPTNAVGKAEICNVEKLYEPILPTDWKLERVIWTGRYYSFSIDPISASERTYSVFHIHPADHFSELLAEYNVTQGTVEQIEDRNAKVYSYRIGSSGRNIKRVKYTLTTNGNKTVYVDEVYCVDESASVLEAIYILVDHNGKYMEISLLGLESRPSVEWLSQFGIREFVETEVS